MNLYWLKLRWYEIVCWVRHLFRRERKLYVGPGGDDFANGQQWDTRRLTLRGIEEIVEPGDTVYVMPHAQAGPLVVAKSGEVRHD